MAWQNYIFHPIIKLEGHCMEKQIHNKLKKDASRSDDLLSNYSCSKFEKCSFEKKAFKYWFYCYKFLSIIPRANLLFQAHTIHLPLLRKAPAGLLKNVKKNRNFQNFKLVVPLKYAETTSKHAPNHEHAATCGRLLENALPIGQTVLSYPNAHVKYGARVLSISLLCQLSNLL